MSEDLEARLKSHARSFDSLLSLIPAKLYYGRDNTTEQWKCQKQTPEQKRAAKKAKLDPDNWKSAKDVADERAVAALKRKRDSDHESMDTDAVEVEKPKVEQELENKTAKKKRKTEPKVEETAEERRQRKLAQKTAKKERRKEKKEKLRLKHERWLARKEAGPQNVQVNGEASQKPKSPGKPVLSKTEGETGLIDIGDTSFALSTNLIEDDQSEEEASDDIFSPVHDSATSSISSVQTPGLDQPCKPEITSTEAETEAEPPKPQAVPTLQPDADAKTRLHAALSAFKSARTPTNPAKVQPKSRAELLAQRRVQEERRKAEKKAQKAREKEEAARRQEEEIAQRFSPGGSGSLLGSPRSPIIQPPSPEASNNSFSFGRIALPDGSSLNADGAVAGQPKRKGPQDPRTALAAAEAKQARLAGLDAEKRETVESKKLWANARKRAAGEKVRDDTSLLKKALKRHEAQKRKSDKEWQDRQEGVKKSIEMRQKKRTENLAKRREDKSSGHKGKKSSSSSRSGGGGGAAAAVRRPGFEGSLKGRTGRGGSSGGKKKN
ncbi:hypothetical protein DV735_g2810, partial [Chaetothyriales sp. CBS 134920]